LSNLPSGHYLALGGRRYFKQMLYNTPPRTFWNTPESHNVHLEGLGQGSSVPKHVREPEHATTHLLCGDEHGYWEIPIPNNRNYFGKIAPPCIVEGEPNGTLWQSGLHSETPLQLSYRQEAVMAFLKPCHDAREQIC